jgi:hypothetical protein
MNEADRLKEASLCPHPFLLIKMGGGKALGNKPTGFIYKE